MGKQSPHKNAKSEKHRKWGNNPPERGKQSPRNGETISAQLRGSITLVKWHRLAVHFVQLSWKKTSFNLAFLDFFGSFIH